jgi:hypothetical protein
VFRRRRDYVSEYRVPPEQAEGSSRLFKRFIGHKGRTVYKWDHYLDLYDKHLSGFEAPRLLEIGVLHGGSLELWREHFPAGTIVGIDIDKGCVERVDPPNRVMIGSQDDPNFLRSVVKSMGGIDIVIDDGSHIGAHQIASFETLFPLLSVGGVYVIEDLHTSYWRDYAGGYGKKRTGIGLLKRLVDDLHQWWHDRGGEATIGAIHIYDSIAFIEKAKPRQPRVVMTRS